MLNTKIKKPIDVELYTKCAKWCNENYGKIVEYDDYYEVVDNHPTEEDLKAQEKASLMYDLQQVTQEISQLNGASMCGYSVDSVTQYDVIKDGELVTVNEDEFNAHFDELTDKRNSIVKQLKG